MNANGLDAGMKNDRDNRGRRQAPEIRFRENCLGARIGSFTLERINTFNTFLRDKAKED